MRKIITAITTAVVINKVNNPRLKAEASKSLY